MASTRPNILWYHNLWLDSGNEALTLQQMRAYMDALMAAVDVGPPRFVNY